MQRFDASNRRLEQWIRVEHYRLHCTERWADSDYKKAVLAAIHSTMKTLEAACVTPVESPSAWFEHPGKPCQSWNFFWSRELPETGNVEPSLPVLPPLDPFGNLREQREKKKQAEVEYSPFSINKRLID
jgi:hypothetical protein